MKKIINGKKYDTETAKEIGRYFNGYNCRDFNYVEETLYKKRTGEFFLHGEGGPMTRYGEKCGNFYGYGNIIIPLTENEAKTWAEKNMDVDDYEELFGEVEE